MKESDVKRAFRVNRHERLVGDAPSLGRVSRMAGDSRRQSRRRSRGARGRRKNRFAILSWSIVVCVLACGVIGAAIFMWLRVRVGDGGAVAQQMLAVPEVVVRVPAKFPSPTEEEILGMAQRALAIRDPKVIPDYFRLGAASPDGVIEFLESLEALDGELQESRWLGSVDANGLSLDGVLLLFEKHGKVRERAMIFTPDDAGLWKIDFEGFARVVKPSWREILKGGGTPATVRIYLMLDSYYNGPFSDDRQWISYGIGSPDTSEILTGYCRVGTPQAEAIRRILLTDEPLIRVTLEIARVEGGSARQFEITRVLAEDWVMGAKPFDESFK